MTIEVLNTERLVLRSIQDSDLDILHERIFSDAEVMAQAFEGKVFSRPDSLYFVANYLDHDGNGKQPGVLILKDSGNVIGFAGLLKCTALEREDYEIGFVLARNYWGKGYATEIGKAQIEYGLKVVGCERLLALVTPGNHASRSVLQKIGMRYHSTVDAMYRGEREVFISANLEERQPTQS